MVRFGGSEFINCSVPLAFAGRYFIIEPGDREPLLSVVREYNGQPVFEVFKNSPTENPFVDVSVTPSGIITVSDKLTGKFMYKVRPGSKTSVVFGTVNGGDITATITDRLISVGGVTVENCVFDGVGAGIVVDKDGGVGIGAPVPHSLLKMFRKREIS